MLSALLKPEVGDFIKAHAQSNADTLNRLLLSKNKYPGIPMGLVVDQIKARQKAKVKLPLWYNTPGVIMPGVLAIEQASSQTTAEHKFANLNGGVAIDITGGAGVDTYFLSRHYQRVIYLEANADIAAIARHNFSCLGAHNIEVIHTESQPFLEAFTEKVNLIYADPARRANHQKMVFFSHCSPNMVNLQKHLFKLSTYVMIKASPMLDIAKAIKQLDFVREVKVVALKNEVKEVLFFLSKEIKTIGIRIEAKDLAENFLFYTTWLKRYKPTYSEPLNYLYEPNAAILKTGKTDVLTHTPGLHKLHPNTHLFTSEKLVPDFPGRIFRIRQVLKYHPKALLDYLGTPAKANIAVRNFPDTVDEFRKKTKISPGGTHYLFGIRDPQKQVKVLCCTKI